MSLFLHFRTLANYLMWRIVSKFKGFAGKKMKPVLFNFDKAYNGRKAAVPSWLSCVRTIQSWMPFAFGRVYVDHFFKFKHVKSEVSSSFLDHLLSLYFAWILFFLFFELFPLLLPLTIAWMVRELTQKS